jgi:3-dehydroquinate dehydratase-1
VKKSFLASSTPLLQKRPLIVGTLTNGAPLAAQLNRAKSAGIDLVELRLDSFPKAYGAFQKAYDFGRSVIRAIKTKTNFPVLLTFRADDERGAAVSRHTIGNKNRAEILARLLPAVDLVDVEIRHSDFARRMTIIARIHGVDVIHSIHDFKTPGKFSALTKWSEASRKLKGDVFKVAVTPKTNDDVEDFMIWGAELKNPKKVLIAMGSAGRISRVVAYTFGSVLTYGHLGASAAPGQMAARDLAQSIKHVYRGN